MIAVSDLTMYTVTAFFAVASLLLIGGFAYLDSKEENR